MTRWLQVVQRELPPTDKTDERDRTQPEAKLVGPTGHPNPVLSVLSVLSGRVKAPAPNPDTSTRAAIIGALRDGLQTPGAIATAARLGATDTYQELDRMAQEGLVIMQRNGALGLNAAAHIEGTQR